MKKGVMFYVAIAILVVIDSYLLANPNLLGKIGLMIYKYHYLRTFPRTLLTVTIVVSVSIIIGLLVRSLVVRKITSRKTARIILGVLIMLCAVLLAKTVMDFSTWAYAHTGSRFRYGAYLLPVMLVMIFTNALVTLPETAPLPPVIEEENNSANADDRP